MMLRKLMGPMALAAMPLLTACEEKPAVAPESESVVADPNRPQMPSKEGIVANANQAATAAAVAVTDKAIAVKEAVKDAVTPGPETVCKELTEKAKAKNGAGVMALVSADGASALAAEAAKTGLMNLLANSTCTDATIDGIHATVAVTGQQTLKTLPFVKATDGWRLDVPALMAAMPKAAANKAVQGAKNITGHGHKNHAKKHH